MSWNDFLPQLAAEHEVLERLFVEIGTPEEERAKQCQALFDKVMEIMSERIDMVRQDKARLEVEIDRMLESLGTLADLLGQDEQGVEQVILAMQEMSLWDRHAFVSGEYRLVSEHYQSKLEEIQQLHRELTHYVNILGPSVVKLGDYPEAGYRVTVDIQQQFSDDIAKCKTEQATRKEFVASAVVTIMHLWNELGLTARDKFDREVIIADVEQYPISDDTLRQLESKRIKLEEERAKREALVKEHIADITRLWDRLRIDDEEREEFITAHIGLTMDTIQSHKAELHRLEKLKLTKLEEFIRDERKTLHELWDRLYYTKEQRECFEPLSDSSVTEANLAAHESEVARLTTLIQNNDPLLETLARYLQFLKDIREFVASSMDSQRLFKAEPGRLLREEKFRNWCQREFPRIKLQLENALHQYQHDNGAPFLVYGEDYLETIDDHARRAWEKQAEETDNQNEQQDDARNGRAPKNATLPRTPTTKRSVQFPIGRPGTPSKGSSTTPTTPTRSRSVTIQPVSNPFSPSRMAQFRASSLQAQQLPGPGPKVRSESPASGLNKLPSTPTKVSRYPGFTPTDHARRSNSVISISSAMDPLDPTSPTRPRTTRLETYDFIETMEEEEEVLPRDLRNDLRQLKRPAEEPLSEPNGAQHKDLKRAESSHMHRHLSSATSSSNYERRSIVTVNSDIEEEEEADVTQNSVVEIDGDELYRSRPRPVKEVVDLRGDEEAEMDETVYEIDDDGWETENDDSPSKRSKTSKHKSGPIL